MSRRFGRGTQGRRTALGMVVVVMSTVLAGCSPEDITAVGLASNGAPVLRNCAAVFRAVDVTDQQSNRAVWSAGKPSGTSVYGVGDVQIGLLPESDWVEQAALSLEPRPVVWRFVIGFREAQPQTVDVPDRDLVLGQLVVAGSSNRLSEQAFRDDVCGEAPSVALKILGISLFVMVLLGIVAAALQQRRRYSHPW